MKNHVPGLRLFIYAILGLIKLQIKETCMFVEENLSCGIATVLYKKYSNIFEKYSFDCDNCSFVDEYFKQLVGISDGREDNYICNEDEGLFLLLKLVLDEIF